MEESNSNAMRSVLLLGDSTMRYLYLSLLALLEPREAVDWKGCQHRCFWNENTYSSWNDFYTSTSRNMFCDCFRGKTCCAQVLENRYAVVGDKLKMDYLQLFGDLEVKGVWQAGDPDELRRPHHEYTPKWVYPVTRFKEVNRTYDTILWNVGHHKCGPVSTLDRIHASLSRAALSRAAPSVVFLSTIGVSPCPLMPSHVHASELIDTRAFRFNASHFWDRKKHLRGEPNRALAAHVATRLRLKSGEGEGSRGSGREGHRSARR